MLKNQSTKMKYILLNISFLLALNCFGQTLNDTNVYKSLFDSLTIKYNQLEKNNQAKRDTIIKRDKEIYELQFGCKNKNLGWTWIYVCSPLILLLIYTIAFAMGLWKLNDPTSKVSKALFAAPSENPNSAQLPHTGKFIAFMCGMTAVFISLIITSFYGYKMVAECNSHIDISGLWTLVLTLGIGIVPYGYYLYKGDNNGQ